MENLIFKIILGVFAIAIGVLFLIKIFRKHKRIDTSSIASVKEIIPLGRDDGRKVYAIRYTVRAQEPFELIVTPCKKIPKIGAEKKVFYEQSDPKNYYFRLIGQFDRRFIMPCIIILCGIMILVSLIIV